ncbi:APC family permease [Candidatus Saccharibacteria bacterium]|nr:APC family permease [Candidatus Saccharibacteria bacterium]MBR6122549.1 APC family permease [Candidatus Saccharibacteria bacterium]
MPAKKPKFRLFSAVLATVCIVLVIDAVAPTAAIGNSQYAWWIIMILGFFIPYALISAELGTQYPSEGGMYTWVKKALGKKWAGRVAWFYWVNFPLWIASLADLMTTLIMTAFGIEVSLVTALIIQIGYIALVTILGNLRISQSAWVANLGAIVKFVVLAGIGAVGIYVFIKQGSANPIESWHDFVPLIAEGGGFDWAGVSFVSLIIFNMLGFEVVGTFIDDMDNPKKQIPQAIILGAVLIALFYILPSFGIGVAVPFEELATNSGLLDSYQILLEAVGLSAGAISAIITVVACLFMYTLIANISSWQFGVYSVTAYAAKDGVFPKSWTKTNKSGAPVVVSLWTSVVAAVLAVAGIILAYCFPEAEELTNMFWAFFDLSLFCLLIGYIPMFFAFMKLHKKGIQDKKGYWIKGGAGKIALFGIVPVIMLVISLFFTLIPEFSMEAILDNKVLIISALVCVVIGEFLVFRASKKDEARKALRRANRK